jgi:trans-2,3-dihydro-3-hydroxyanthranilate isomerase
MSRPCHVVRVFTRGDEGGNHLGVVNDVVGVSGEQMQAIATGLGFSETIFVDWADATREPVVRIFTPVNELPFAGHPLVGAAWVLGSLGPEPVGGFITQVGRIVCASEGDAARITASIAIDVVQDDVAEVAESAQMPPPQRSVRLALPNSYLMAQYATFEDVARLEPDMDALEVFGFAAFARRDDTVKLRFFAPASGVPEDPATGSAAVALARTFGLWGEPEGSVTINQGDEIGHPSTISLAWTPRATTIGGTVRSDGVVLVP